LLGPKVLAPAGQTTVRNSFAVPEVDETVRRPHGQIRRPPVGEAGVKRRRSSLLAAQQPQCKSPQRMELTARRLSHFGEKNSST
jgi:hypothetical protein